MIHGAQIFIHNDFDISNPGTYMSGIIRVALSLDNYNLGEAPVKYNHCANVVEIDGILWVFEAGWNKFKKRGEIIKTEYNEWSTKRKPNSFLIKVPNFEFDRNLYQQTAIDQLGKPYGYVDVIWAMPWHLLFRKKYWWGSKGTTSFYCSKFSAYLYFMSADKFKDNWYKKDPEELFDDQLFINS